VVSWLHDNDTDYQPAEQPEGPRWVPTLVGALVLATIGVGSAFGWHAYGGSPYPSFAFGTSAASEPKPIGLDEFHAFQQQSTAQMQSSAQALAAQQAEMKRLSDQVAAVSAKIDAIQSSIASARAAIPAARPIAPKKPSQPKPAAARVPTGAAPLPPPIQLAH
jgi:uncharacterized coiled-coil protein SlyX